MATSSQQERIDYLSKAFPRIGKAYRLKEQFKEIWLAGTFSEGIAMLHAWMELAAASQLEPLQVFALTLHNHWSGIREYLRHRLTNAYAVCVNRKIQQIRRIAGGYANIGNYISMIYFHLGSLKLGLPTVNG